MDDNEVRLLRLGLGPERFHCPSQRGHSIQCYDEVPHL